MTPRYLFTFLLVAFGFSLVFLIPENTAMDQTRIKPQLPTFVGEWFGEPMEITQEEINTLAPDTEFSRRAYTNMGEVELTVSTILSGHDMIQSIHRPELCLTVQGWTIVNSTRDKVLPDNPETDPITLTLLDLARFVEIPEGDEQFPNGGTRHTYAINAYFFVGAETITASHYARSLSDIWRRVYTGRNQRWAFVMVMGSYGSYIVPSGGLNEEQERLLAEQVERQKREVKEEIYGFLKELLPEVLLEDSPGTIHVNPQGEMALRE